jgi:hypothetical protein
MDSAFPLLDYGAAQKARDEGIKEVSENNQTWMALALLQIEQFARTHDGWANTEHGVTGEGIRVMLVPRVGHPNSQNCYGALIRTAIKRGLLVETGTLRAMKTEKSNARRTMVYRFGRGA